MFLAEKFASLSQPVRMEVKTTTYASVFPRLASAAYISFSLWLVDEISLRCDWPK